MSYKEALFFTFWIMKEIEATDKDCVISTKWFWSAIIKYNKSSISVKAFPSINESDNKERLWKLLNNFLIWLQNVDTEK